MPARKDLKAVRMDLEEPVRHRARVAGQLGQLLFKVGPEGNAETPLDLGAVEKEIAHELRDDVPAQGVVRIEDVAALDGEPAVVERGVVRAELLRVLRERS